MQSAEDTTYKRGAKTCGCAVVCQRSDITQSTHILTALTMAGVKRLLHSNRSAIVLPLLAWLQDTLNHIVTQENGIRLRQQSPAAETCASLEWKQTEER